MSGEPVPDAVLSPDLTVGVLSSISTAIIVGAAGTVLLVPVAWALSLPAAPLPVVLVGVGALAGSLRALVRTYAVEYRIYEKKIEVETALGDSVRIAPRSDIRYVSLSADTLASQVGGGDVAVTVRRHNTRYQLHLTDLADADAWYEELRPVDDGEPQVRFSRRIAPSLLPVLGYTAAGVGLLGGCLALASPTLVPSLTVPRIALGGALVWAAVAAWYFLYLASIEYYVHGNHIERQRLFLGTDRSYAIANHINGVEHVRDVPEQLFDVGTVSVRTRWRDRPFHLRSVEGSNEVYRELRQST